MSHDVDESLHAGLAAWGARVRTSGVGPSAESGTGAEVDAVWRRGRRWGRRRRTAQVAGVLASLALVAGTVVGVAQVTPEVLPATTGTAQVPDQLFDMPAWGDDLEPQPLLAVTLAERATWKGTRVQAAGIAAATGEYGYLDLPGLVGAPELSADGRYLAWWSSLGDEEHPDSTSFSLMVSDTAAHGFQIMDLQTGEVTTHREESDHGVLPNQLDWMGETPTLVLSRVPLDADGEPDLDEGYRTFTWQPGQDVEAWPWRSVRGHGAAGGVDSGYELVGPAVAPGIDLSEGDDLAPGAPFAALQDGVYLSSGDGATTGLIAVDGTERRVRDVPAGDTAVTEVGASSLVWSGDGRLAAQAYPASGEGTAGALMVGRLDLPLTDRSRAVLAEVPGGERNWKVLGWRGDELLVRDFSGDDDEILTVVVEGEKAGESSRLTRHLDGLANEEGVYRVPWSLAVDVVGTGEVVTAAAPPAPADPRLLLGGSLGGLLVVLVGLGWWWRRARP